MRWATAVVVTLLVGVAGWAWAVPAGPAAASAESAAAAPKADAASNDAPAKNGTATEASARPGDDPAAQRKAREDAARQQREFARTRYTVTSGKPKMSFESIAIKDVLNYLASIGKFSIVFDQALDEANIDLSTRTVTLKASGMTYEDAINLILPRECGYRIGPGYVLITTLEKSYLPLRTGIYSIQLALAQVPDFTDAPRFEVSAVTQAATAAAGSGGGGGFGNIFGGAKAAVEEDTSRATPEKIIDLVKKFVKNSNDRRIAPWDDEGGPATIQYLGGKLVVSQTDYGHRAVAKFLASVE